MTTKKVLVVHNSSTGNTRKVGEAIASALSAHVGAIHEVNPRQVGIQGKGSATSSDSYALASERSPVGPSRSWTLSSTRPAATS